MRLYYRRIALSGAFIFIFFVFIDWLMLPKSVHRIKSNQRAISAEDFETVVPPRVINPLEAEQLLPVPNQLWQWLPGGMVGKGSWVGQKQHTDIPEITAMKKTLAMLNENVTSQTDKRLMDMIRKFWLRPPSLQAYNLDEPNIKDFSKGQSPVVDRILHQKKNGFFVECGALDGETRSNTLFFERERGWSGLLIEAGPINYRKLVKKHRQAYSTPACLGMHPFPTKMYFHRGKNRGRLIDGKKALEWVRQQAMSVWLMEVQCFPLFSLLVALNQTRIDYFSLDVEGVEQKVLETIPWDDIHISVLTVEFAHGKEGKQALRSYMEARGYETVAEVVAPSKLANDFVFRKHDLV